MVKALSAGGGVAGRRLLPLLLAASLLAGCAVGANRPMQLLAGDGPQYPAAAREAGIEGEVTLRYDVTRRGEVTNVRVIAADPPGVFDAAAIAAVRSWKYRPPQVGGVDQPAADVTSTVRFRLGDGDEYVDYD